MMTDWYQKSINTLQLNGGDAALSALLAWSVWFAVHALGERS